MAIRVTSLDAGENGPNLLDDAGTVVRVSVPWRQEWLGASAADTSRASSPPRVFYLLNDDDRATPIVFNPGPPDAVSDSWQRAFGDERFAVAVSEAGLSVEAKDTAIRDIRVRGSAVDPFPTFIDRGIALRL
jgi:hypothetical protein